MGSQQVVENPDREFRLFLLGAERAAHLRNLNVVVALFDTGNHLDGAKPATDANAFSAMVEESPFVFHLAGNKEHAIRQDAVDRKAQGCFGDATRNGCLSDEGASVVLPERR